MSRVRRLAQRLRDGEAGVTLVELICAVAIVSIAFVAILSAMGTAVIVSDVHKRQSTAETVLGSWAETLKAHEYLAEPGNGYDADQLGIAVPAGYAAEPAVVQCDADPESGTFEPADPPGPPCASGLQQVTLTVTSARGVVRTTNVLMRAPPT